MRNMEKAFKEHHQLMTNQKREIPDRNVERAIDYVYNRKRADPVNDYSAHQYELDMYHDYMYNQDIDDNDPLGLASDVHDSTLAGMKEQLLEAINKRKEKVLGVAINIFNKLQD
jgi:hypothetical protein